MLSTAQVAEILGVDTSRVRQLILDGKLKATRFGERAHMIDESDLEVYRQSAQSIIGRPRKGTKPMFTIHIPKVGWDDEHTALVEQHIDDETFLSVDLIATRMPGDWQPGDVVAGHLSERFHVRHAVVVRYEGNTEVRNVSPREIELIWNTN